MKLNPQVECSVVFCSLLLFVDSMPLNFRFSPKFDYSLRDSKPTERVKAAKIYLSSRTDYSRYLPGLEKLQYRRGLNRHIRDTTAVDKQLRKLRARLAFFKSQQESYQDRWSDMLFNEDEPTAKHDQHEAVHSDPPQTPSASKVPSDDSAATQSDWDRDHRHVNWAEKLHNKHIFTRDIQILGNFPKLFPVQHHENKPTTIPAAVSVAPVTLGQAVVVSHQETPFEVEERQRLYEDARGSGKLRSSPSRQMESWQTSGNTREKEQLALPWQHESKPTRARHKTHKLETS